MNAVVKTREAAREPDRDAGQAPIKLRVVASITNWTRMFRRRALTARRTPISRVRTR